MFLGTAQHLQAELVVLVDRAQLLGALLLGQLRQRDAHLVVVGGGERELHAVVGLIHLARRGHREEVGHVLLELDRHRRVVLRRADVAHHDEDLVLVHQLLRRQHRALGVVAGVLDQQLDLAAVHAALLVELIDAQVHAQADLLAVAGQRAGQVLDGADDDLVLGDALPLRMGQRRKDGSSRGGGRGEDPAVLHGISLLG
jgi:hypothetical protein